MKWFKRVLLTSAGIALAGVIICAVINFNLTDKAAPFIFATVASVPSDEEPRTAIVLGAGVHDDGTPSNTLYDRVLVGVELYRAGRVDKLLMSGDRKNDAYDEPAVMKKLAMELGVPENLIILDGDGKRTRDTCDRAVAVYGINRAILVTQDYHLPRSIFLCRAAGIDSTGVVANRRTYDGENWYRFREIFSRVSAWYETKL